MSDDDAPFGEPMFSREMLDNVPRNDHDCGLPYVDERCPREVMVKLFMPNAGDALFSNYAKATTRAIRDSFELPVDLRQGQRDWNIAIGRESLDFYHARMLGDGCTVNASSPSGAPTTITPTATAINAAPPCLCLVVLDADYESLLESADDCKVTIVHPDALAALAGAMGVAARSIGTGPQCTDHDLFTDDDGKQRCVFCMATQEEIDMEESLLQAQAHEVVYGACEHCGTFDDDDHDSNCPRRLCTEEDAAHEQRTDDPGRYNDDFDPDYPDDDGVVIDPPNKPEDG